MKAKKVIRLVTTFIDRISNNVKKQTIKFKIVHWYW